ncbi:uncharacterized protein BDR25DRAFT_317032 [Lindgomyces ingoldianus]|uniref:Uncharacterized protein n=1 Tax=Lindgomyces ingoldianus TaxID=673940 RepID=A0ACB6QJT0_9PLEO|nr:uncharacterized protein BDR25DRAFT_317032 [Lindgomyces ingoldianus]KAF2467279.1 hypothetical protein BDR25DRAFT_317032 [Lindgomyces ingoldianus]
MPTLRALVGKWYNGGMLSDVAGLVEGNPDCIFAYGWTMRKCSTVFIDIVGHRRKIEHVRGLVGLTLGLGHDVRAYRSFDSPGQYFLGRVGVEPCYSIVKIWSSKSYYRTGMRLGRMLIVSLLKASKRIGRSKSVNAMRMCEAIGSTRYMRNWIDC